MEGREFVQMVKQEAVDQVVELSMRGLRSPRVPRTAAVRTDAVDRNIGAWIQARVLAEQHRSKWFNSLTEEEQQVVQTLIAEVAELAVYSVFTTIDGVGGPYEGVFEVVAVDAEEHRTLVNPQNTEMLHDLFSEVCEQGRGQ